MRDRLASLYTAALADALDELGLRTQTLPPQIRPLRPGMRLAGPAFTIEGHPAETRDWDATIRRTLAALGSVPAGQVAVYACHQDASAHFGELSAAALQARGVAGCVVDGGCRDARFIAEAGFPVFTRFVTPEDSTWRWQLEATQVPIAIGRVRIEPGDWVVGDEDGVVVVPAAVVDEVLAAAARKAGTEDEVRAAVRAGVPPLAAYERHGAF